MPKETRPQRGPGPHNRRDNGNGRGPGPDQGEELVMVQFKGHRKGDYHNRRQVPLEVGQYCLVEADRGPYSAEELSAPKGGVEGGSSPDFSTESGSAGSSGTPGNSIPKSRFRSACRRSAAPSSSNRRRTRTELSSTVSGG